MKRLAACTPHQLVCMHAAPPPRGGASRRRRAQHATAGGSIEAGARVATAATSRETRPRKQLGGAKRYIDGVGPPVRRRGSSSGAQQRAARRGAARERQYVRSS
jgi:hypothetical protein